MLFVPADIRCRPDGLDAARGVLFSAVLGLAAWALAADICRLIFSWGPS